MHELEQLLQGVDTILPDQSLEKKLQEGRPLVIKAGFDPTAADLHLGHTVLIEKLRQFQMLGHEVVFIVGDYTAMIGDPSGRNVTRPPLSEDEVLKNAKTYQEQVFKILDAKKTKVVYNSEWLGKLSGMDLIKLAGSQTVARMLEREDFSKRYKSLQPINLHEFLYPLLQGYDSYHLKADIELGGTDQTFNLLMGREIQKHFGQAPQSIITMPLLEGLDGVKKMSKSYGNYIGINSPAKEIFGQVMSISDVLMWRYFDLVSGVPYEAIQGYKQDIEGGANPRDIKIELAKSIVGRFYSEVEVASAQQAFIDQFSKQKLPKDIPQQVLTSDELKLPLSVLLRQSGIVSSSSEATRLIKQNAVKFNGSPITELPSLPCVIQVGKRRFIEFIV
ncbi:tyrosine--tRNA ligase [Gammaproteobacteria bacterium]|nr:tyrosine--tRNA ligase [Gammaproteobacteria bacterium]